MKILEGFETFQEVTVIEINISSAAINFINEDIKNVEINWLLFCKAEDVNFGCDCSNRILVFEKISGKLYITERIIFPTKILPELKLNIKVPLLISESKINLNNGSIVINSQEKYVIELKNGSVTLTGSREKSIIVDVANGNVNFDWCLENGESTINLKNGVVNIYNREGSSFSYDLSVSLGVVNTEINTNTNSNRSIKGTLGDGDGKLLVKVDTGVINFTN